MASFKKQYNNNNYYIYNLYMSVYNLYRNIFLLKLQNHLLQH